MLRDITSISHAGDPSLLSMAVITLQRSQLQRQVRNRHLRLEARYGAFFTSSLQSESESSVVEGEDRPLC